MVLLYIHAAKRLDYKAKGHLERLKMMEEAEAERARKELVELQAHRYISQPYHIYRNYIS